MSVVIPAGYAQFVLNYRSSTFDSGGAATVLGYGATGDPVLDADDFALLMREEWANTMAPATHDAITLESIYWQTTTQSGEIPANIDGGRSGALAPPGVTVLSSYSTGFKGPRARGRSYWPGLLLDPDIDDSGVIFPGRLGELETAITTFLAVPEADEIPQVVLQRDEPGQVTPPITPPPAINSIVVRSKVASQRRRNRR